MSDHTLNAGTQTDDLSRRTLLSRVSLLLGGAAATQLLGGNAISTALAYTPQADSAGQDGKLFSQADMAALRDICTQVIPATQTPGAAEVDTHGFIDNQLFHCHPATDQQRVKSVLAQLNEVAQSRHGQPFSDTSASEQLALLTDLETPDNGFSAYDKESFKLLKRLIVVGYYTSEVGASQELVYLAYPGGYKGSVPYDSVGKAWGSMRSYVD